MSSRIVSLPGLWFAPLLPLSIVTSKRILLIPKYGNKICQHPQFW
jgi:hypothetical protein